MACKQCEEGVWVCEEGNNSPKCGPQLEIQASWDYQGRYRVPKGEWTVWCRSGSNVVISLTQPQPLPTPSPPWAAAGTICFPDRGDYDIWKKPGTGCELMVVRVENTSAASDCDP
jgi:hypothetical protein